MLLRKFKELFFPALAEKQIVNFYINNGPDNKDRLLKDMLSWDFEKLEYTHDYIQWLFPLDEESQFNGTAPILNIATISILERNVTFQQNYLQSFQLMLNFYGFELISTTDAAIKIIPSALLLQNKGNWITPHNHNYLRITRILKSLIIFGKESYAKAFYHALKSLPEEYKEIIGQTSFEYWGDAVIWL